MLTALEIRLANLLKKKILEERETRVDGMIGGIPKEYADYREIVGYIRALRDIERWIEDIQHKLGEY